MGTNYYVKQDDACPHCGHRDDDVHVGKSSAGWKFCFNGTRRKTLAEWVAYLRQHEGKMFDEYGRPFSTDDLLELIAIKSTEHDIYPGEWVVDGCRFYLGEFS